MVNSHPSILYEFSKKKKLKLNGSLKELVIKRSEFFKKLTIELNNSDPDILKEIEVKTIVLKALNKIHLSRRFKKTSFSLVKLHLDFTEVRDYFCIIIIY